MRPATSDIGVNSGSSRDGNSTVSYAMHVAPLARCARVNSSSAAKCRYVNSVRSGRRKGHSRAIGSFTFSSSSALAHVDAASGMIVAPTSL